ncbi:MAG: hypothetical protein AAFX87_17710 [Bacteroidota bacterium]
MKSEDQIRKEEQDKQIRDSVGALMKEKEELKLSRPQRLRQILFASLVLLAVVVVSYLVGGERHFQRLIAFAMALVVAVIVGLLLYRRVMRRK